MTPEEMHDLIAEEHSDADRYDTLAEEHPDFHGLFHDMACEERAHARHLEYILSHLQA